MSEMIERVARALCVADRQNPDAIVTGSSRFGGIVTHTVNVYLWRWYVDDARAAIAAMREPTYEQLTSAGKVAPECDGNFVAIWQAMIDAALKSDAEPHA